MADEYPDNQAQQSTPWYIGLHDSGLIFPQDEGSVAETCAEGLRLAQAANYNMTTCSVTTSAFYERVRLDVVSYYERERQRDTEQALPAPVIAALRPEDSVLAPNASISQILAVSSSWIDLASSDYVIADVSRQVFNLEVAYAAFCGTAQLVVPGPVLPDGTISLSSTAQFARALLEAHKISPYIQYHVVLPMVPIKTGGTALLHTLPGNQTAHISSAAAHRSTEDANAQDQWAAWEAWDMIRTICKYSPRVTLALVVPKQTPPASIQARWFSEPVSMLVFSQSSFVPNKYKQPVLQKTQQTMLFRMMRLRTPPWLLLNDISTISSSSQERTSNLQDPESIGSSEPTPAEASAMKYQRYVSSVSSDPTPHLSYLRALQRKEQPRPPIEQFGSGYQDYLQMPLQPLADNLESVTYEVFEKDPIKYEWYERAIAFALHDWQDAMIPGSCTADGASRIVIAIAGSGRGPLVSRALAAADAALTDVDVWAVEKNPNAYVLLQRYNQEKWGGRVTVVKTDMRAWKGPVAADGTHYKVDILVSELLGSFADNELSPECLDGVEHVLSNHGISIPSSYTALLTPIATPRLYADILGKSKTSNERLLELPYVVLLHQFDFLSYTKTEQQKDNSAIRDSTAEVEPSLPLKTPIVLPCWSFDHPQPPHVLAQAEMRRGGSAAGGGGGPTGGDGANAHNTRFCRLDFPCPRRGVCHGLAGYFETVLYNSRPYRPSDNDSVADDEWEDEDGEEAKVELSTNPLTMARMSNDMISWFPIFFPVKAPISFPDSSELVVSMWRQTDDRKVWYEWFVETFLITDKGQRTRLNVSELHSSQDNGCLM